MRAFGGAAPCDELQVLLASERIDSGVLLADPFPLVKSATGFRREAPLFSTSDSTINGPWLGPVPDLLMHGRGAVLAFPRFVRCLCLQAPFGLETLQPKVLKTRPDLLAELTSTKSIRDEKESGERSRKPEARDVERRDAKSKRCQMTETPRGCFCNRLGVVWDHAGK